MEYNHKSLLREFMIRAHYVPPTNQIENIWWNQGTNDKQNPGLMKRFLKAIEN